MVRKEKNSEVFGRNCAALSACLSTLTRGTEALQQCVKADRYFSAIGTEMDFALRPALMRDRAAQIFCNSTVGQIAGMRPSTPRWVVKRPK